MARSAAQAQDAYLERSQRNDKIATGVLTLIVGLVMLIVVSMVLFILSQGIETFSSPVFLPRPRVPMVLKAVWRISYLTRFTC